MSKQQTAIVLQGGGALGAYEFGVLKRLYEIPDFAPDVVTGVSIGAINAAVLVGARDDDPIAALESLWAEFTVAAPPFMPDWAESLFAAFGNQSFYSPRYDYANAPVWTSFYRTEPLARKLAAVLDLDRLNAAPPKLAVTATNVSTGRIDVFDNHTEGQPLTVDHIVASGSLPPGFPMTRVNGREYWDGGLFDNTPLGPMIDRLDAGATTTRRIFVVKLFPSAAQVPGNMVEVFDRMFELMFSCKLTADVETVRKVNDFVEAIVSVDKALGRLPDKREAAKIRRMPGYRRLKKYKAIQEITFIENTDPELVVAPFDFSRDRIGRRIDAGYWDADRCVREMEPVS